jgi:invasion protein IalB
MLIDQVHGESCEPNRCIATLILDSAFIRHAMIASATTVTMRASNGGTVQFKFSIKGFDKACGQLEAAAN